MRRARRGRSARWSSASRRHNPNPNPNQVEEQASLAAIKALPPLPQFELPTVAEPPYPELPHFSPPALPEPLAGSPPAANAYDVAEGDAYTRVNPKPKP